MKRLLAVILGAFLCLLSACGDEPGAEADLVFVNNSDAAIVAVLDFQDRGEGSRYADSSPLKKDETFGFEAGEYPVTVAVYNASLAGPGQRELARLTISDAPPEAERWYVTARDGADGLSLSADTVWPVDDGGEED